MASPTSAPKYKASDYMLPLPQHYILRVMQYYPYIGSAELLPQMPSILAKFKDEDGDGTEFGFSWTFDPEFVVATCYNACFPMSLPIGEPHFVFAVKLHKQRCVLTFDKLHVSKSTKKRSKPFTMSINQQYDRVLKECHKQHGENWLCTILRKSFTYLNQNRENYKVKFHSIELWEGENLVAGELGYTTGTIYTSLTGFYNVNATGSVQLLALGKLLEKNGFEVWDFGMSLPYKAELGAYQIPREQWIKTVVEKRDKVVNFQCGTPENPKENCSEIINWKPKQAMDTSAPKEKPPKTKTKKVRPPKPTQTPTTGQPTPTSTPTTVPTTTPSVSSTAMATETTKTENS